MKFAIYGIRIDSVDEAVRLAAAHISMTVIRNVNRHALIAQKILQTE